jgi:predicted nucleotidyltransferase component of viral defense system
MRIKLINEISKTLGISRNELIEKDIIIHEILTDLSKTDFFTKNYFFKGGTCLIKSYLGYYRFSEDMDFTWKDQQIFKNKSQGQTRDYLSNIIDETGKLLEEIALKRNLDFQCKKGNRDYVELGGSNKRCTFKIFHDSEVTKKRSFIKFQINYVEKICFPSQKQPLFSLMKGKDEKLRLLFSEHDDYFESIDFEVYDKNEILCEKIRAILTRQATKARDFLDVYLLCKKYTIDISKLEKEISEKLTLALEMYERYEECIKQKAIEIESGNLFEWGDEQNLLLEKINEDDFYAFNKKLVKFLNKIIPNKYHSVLYKLPISAICSGGDGTGFTPHKITIPNSGGDSFDTIDLSKQKCPQCGLVGKIQAMPGL